MAPILGLALSILPYLLLSSAHYIAPADVEPRSTVYPWEVATKCRCFPGDKCWPKENVWQQFNKTVDGALIRTQPLASPCHDPNYDEAKCNQLKQQWRGPDIHLRDPASPMAAYFAKASCDPFLPRNSPCNIGAYVQYSVKAANAKDVSETIKFANRHNIRIVIRNSAHDYLGRSTGAGAIAIWTHHMTDIEIKNYESKQYKGKAIKVAAGVQLGAAYKAAADQKHFVVGGHCPTVGYAGGYTQGGGHGAMTSSYGLAADQTLEFEVVDGRGRILRASRKENTELYWALSGGGGGTFGVVTSMTSRIHPDRPVTHANITFPARQVADGPFYEIVSASHAILPTLGEKGVTAVNFMGRTNFMLMMTTPEISYKELTDLLAPLRKKFEDLKVPYSYGGFESPSYAAETAIPGPGAPVGSTMGGWFIPRKLIDENNEGLTKAVKFIFENGGGMGNIVVNASRGVPEDTYNAVSPHWRNAIVMTALSVPYNHTASLAENEARQKRMTDVIVPALSKLAPDAGAYLNEADFRQPNFQDVFYGSTYKKLNSVKNKYDPDHTFYGATNVGSEYWTEQSDGRLCRAK
ncbi:hypothetical protein FQN57_007453 [Myotisia sp. PD_48]|nr:hypothetical protein FQN57_007453 [Myotisia sp. PD_48]